MKKAGKLLPKNPDRLKKKPEQAARLFNARNLPRKGGAAGGGPWQKIDPKTPGMSLPFCCLRSERLFCRLLRHCN